MAVAVVTDPTPPPNAATVLPSPVISCPRVPTGYSFYLCFYYSPGFRITRKESYVFLLYELVLTYFLNKNKMPRKNTMWVQ
jgi:hypothetical protein